MRKIIIKNEKTEITVNEQEISVSAPNISLTVMLDEKTTSITTVTKDEIVSHVKEMEQTGKPCFNC